MQNQVPMRSSQPGEFFGTKKNLDILHHPTPYLALAALGSPKSRNRKFCPYRQPQGKSEGTLFCQTFNSVYLKPFQALSKHQFSGGRCRVKTNPESSFSFEIFYFLKLGVVCWFLIFFHFLGHPNFQKYHCQWYF